MPIDAAPIAFVKGKGTRIENRNGLAVVVSAEVAPYHNTPELAGRLAVAVRVDTWQLRLVATPVEANVIGAGSPISIVGKRGAGGRPMTVPIPLDAEWDVGELQLHAVPVLTPYHASWVRPLRYGAGGLGIVFPCTFLVLLRTARRR